jgi:hypothetical protein
VQTVIPLDKTHALKLTTALYHTPSGRIIQNVGIVPDVRIEDLKIAQNATDAINGTGAKADIARRAQEVVKQEVAQAQAQVEMLLSEIKVPGTEMDLTRMAESIEGERMLASFQQKVAEGERSKLLHSGLPQQKTKVVTPSFDYFKK